MDGVSAYEAGDHHRCADALLEVEASDASIPANGELLVVECLGLAGRQAEAFGYLRRQLPSGRIALDALRGKSRPGLDALRRHPGWPVLLAEAEAAEATRMARLDTALRGELLARAERDQQARRAALVSSGEESDPAHWHAVRRIDDDNNAWLQKIVDASGWPGSDRVGHDGAKAAWMLVQHADHDPAFQRRALDHMAASVEAGLADRTDFAMLTDRVLLAEGVPQRYGTQFATGQDGVMRVRPVSDEAGLEDRRRAMGLPSMAAYREMLADMYGLPVE